MSAIKTAIKNHLPRGIRQKLTPRSINAICLSTPKSGTTSIASLFSKNYRQDHEGERREFVKVIFRHFIGELDDSSYIQYLINRDRRQWLDIESSCFLGYRPDLTFKAFPTYKFILTIREPYSWLESIFDNNLNYPISRNETMGRWHRFFFLPDQYSFNPQETVLKSLKLYPVQAYLSYWLKANSNAIESIPSDQLLILETSEISNSLEQIAQFLNIPADSISDTRNHENITTQKHGVSALLDEQYLRDQVELTCNEFISKHQLFA